MCKDATRQAGQENYVKLRNGPVFSPIPIPKPIPNLNHFILGNLMMSADCCGRATQKWEWLIYALHSSFNRGPRELFQAISAPK